ncbi:hypothetical protein PQX77_012737 [Marasmius sp. AFHP31]|nr:hypothetical protein PQX77_012737 [Marasmius sp. AFHP31]
MSDNFSHSQNVSVTGGNFSHVGRDQHNHYNQIVQQKEKKHTEFDNYRNVKSGDISRLKDIGVFQYRSRRDCSCYRSESSPCWRCEGLEADRTICVVKVDGSPDPVHTAVTYSGRDARAAFVADFRRTHQVAQVFAIDIGTVPSLLLRNELVPFAHFAQDIDMDEDILARLYFHNLCNQWDCRGEELWIDSVRGVFCRGPAGPKQRYNWRTGLKFLKYEIKDPPSSVDFLQEDVLWRFLTSQKSKELDEFFIDFMAQPWASDTGSSVPQDLPNPNATRVFSATRDAPIAIARSTWKDYSNPPLLDQTFLENGLTRFRLGDGRTFRLEMGKKGMHANRAWMSQAWSIFHALGITLEADPEDFRVLNTRIRLCEASFLNPEQNDDTQSIFLSLHFPQPAAWAIPPCSTIGLFEKMVALPFHLRLATILGFQLSSITTPVYDLVQLQEISEEERVTGSSESHLDSNPEDVYDSDDYSLTALFDTDSDDVTYANSAHISHIQERNDPYEDSLSSSDARAQDFPVSLECELTTGKDHGVNERTGVESGAKFRGTERGDHPNQALECTAPFASNAENSPLSSASNVDPPSDDTSSNVVSPGTPPFPTHSIELPISHPEVYEDDGANHSPAYTDLNISPIGQNTTAFLSRTLQNIGWLTMSRHKRGCENALASRTHFVASYPHDLTARIRECPTTTVETINGDASLTHHHNEGSFASIPQQRWVPRSFVPNVRFMTHPASGPVPVTSSPSGQSRSPIGITGDRDENEDLD